MLTVQEGKLSVSAWMDCKTVMVMSTANHMVLDLSCKMDHGFLSLAQTVSSLTTSTWEE